jgi:hypothetical protein
VHDIPRKGRAGGRAPATRVELRAGALGLTRIGIGQSSGEQPMVPD